MTGLIIEYLVAVGALITMVAVSVMVGWIDRLRYDPAAIARARVHQRDTQISLDVLQLRQQMHLNALHLRHQLEREMDGLDHDDRDFDGAAWSLPTDDPAGPATGQ